LLPDLVNFLLCLFKFFTQLLLLFFIFVALLLNFTL
jgi:hypothetical protein